MKQYLCLLRGGESRFQKFTKQQIQEHMAQWGAYIGSVGDKYLGGAPIAMSGYTIKDWGKESKSSPYGAGVPVNGYMILSANNYKEAVKLAKGCPIFELGGSVEIREIMKM